VGVQCGNIAKVSQGLNVATTVATMVAKMMATNLDGQDCQSHST